MDRAERNNLHHTVRNATAKIHRRLDEIERATEAVQEAPVLVHAKDITVWGECVAVAWHPKLILLHAWLWAEYPGRLVATSAWREGDGIHGTIKLRAFDLRADTFPSARAVEKETNSAWDYGKPPYRCCVYHRTATCRTCGHRFEVEDIDGGIQPDDRCPKCSGGNLRDNGKHLHFQVRDETERRNT